jgi:hypothetical protein
MHYRQGMRERAFVMNLSELIVGSWANIDKDGLNFGMTRDRYYPNGTKDIEVVVHKSGKNDLYKATANWRIDKNILTEEITSIDKKAIKAFGFKVGFKTRAYIQSLDSRHLTIKQLRAGASHLSKPVTLTKVGASVTQDQ